MFVFIFLIVFTGEAAAERYAVPCKKLPDGITLQKLEAGMESYRRGDLSFNVANVLTCKAALPVLKKYAFDPDRKMRNIVSNALSRAYYDFYRSFYPEVFRLLVAQIEKFPTEDYSLPVTYTSRYGCYYFKVINAPRLTDAIIKRIEFRSGEFNRDEIDLLGCLARRAPRAKEFLLALYEPQFQTALGQTERQQQREYLRFPLAEAGVKEMEEEVLSEINDLIASGDSERIQNSLPGLRNFTNPRIVRRFIELLNDKREITVANYVRFERNEFKVALRDYMVVVFTSVFGRKVTGEYDQNFRVHTDAEIEKIYRRVKSFAGRKVFTDRPK